MSAYLTSLQRTAPPMDRTIGRRGLSGGGMDTVSALRTLAPGIENDQTRTPGTVFDGGIIRDRNPYYQRPRYTPPGNGWVNWTAAGPVRPELHMRNFSLRTMQGNTESRFPVVATPTTGMHTEFTAGTERTTQRFLRTPQMTSARINRLSPSVSANRTYSQTTVLQGRRG